MKLLMHICCAPCANLPIDVLRADGIDLTGYWYNPNIHPFTEYRARRNAKNAQSRLHKKERKAQAGSYKQNKPANKKKRGGEGGYDYSRFTK